MFHKKLAFMDLNLDDSCDLPKPVYEIPIPNWLSIFHVQASLSWQLMSLMFNGPYCKQRNILVKLFKKFIVLSGTWLYFVSAGISQNIYKGNSLNASRSVVLSLFIHHILLFPSNSIECEGGDSLPSGLFPRLTHWSLPIPFVTRNGIAISESIASPTWEAEK